MKQVAVEILRSVFDLPCWQVRWDLQVGLDMKFGTPRLEVRQPRASDAKSARVRAMFARRGVFLHGTHWLVASAASWRLELRDGLIVRDTSPVRRLDMAVARLEGEVLQGFRIDTRSGATVLHFDLGARVLIRAHRGNSGEFPLWSLSNATRAVEIYPGGEYCFGSVRRSLSGRLPLSADDGHFLVVARSARLRKAMSGKLPLAAV